MPDRKGMTWRVYRDYTQKSRPCWTSNALHCSILTFCGRQDQQKYQISKESCHLFLSSTHPFWDIQDYWNCAHVTECKNWSTNHSITNMFCEGIPKSLSFHVDLPFLKEVLWFSFDGGTVSEDRNMGDRWPILLTVGGSETRLTTWDVSIPANDGINGYTDKLPISHQPYHYLLIFLLLR